MLQILTCCYEDRKLFDEIKIYKRKQKIMKMFKFALLSCSLFILFGCSGNRESLPRTKIVETEVITLNNGTNINVITENAINGQVINDTNNYLNVVTRGDTAEAVGVKMVQFATAFFGNLGGNVNTFSKTDLKGSYVNSVPNKTMELLKPQLYTILKKIKANKQKEHTITIQPYKFKLIYDGITDNKYNFIYQTFIKTNGFTFTCSSDSLALDDKTKTFDAWESNNYQLVQNITSKLINNCITQLSSEKNFIQLEDAFK